MLRLMSDLVPALLASRDGVLKYFDLRWYRRRGADRRDGGEGLSRRLREEAPSSTVWRGRCGRGRRDLPCRHPGSRTAASSPMAAACSTSRRSARLSPRRARGPIQAVDRIDWPEGFCRRDIGWRAVERERLRPGDCLVPIRSIGRSMKTSDRQNSLFRTREVAERLRFDVERLETYLRDHVQGFAGPITLSQFKGGQSNPTYLVETPAAPLRAAAQTARQALAVGARGRPRVPRHQRAPRQGFPVAEPIALLRRRERRSAPRSS